MTIVQDKPPTTSQPSAGDLDIGSTSGEGGEVARIVGSANPEFVVSPFHTFSNSPIMFSSDGAPRDIDTGVGNVKPGELGRVSDLLDGSSKYVQKCSLNDIMFLVMLILIKSTSEQRESRFEGMMAKKDISAQTSIAVYELKKAEAEATYEKEKKAAELKQAMACVSMGCACLSIAGSIAGAASQTGNAIAKIASAVVNAFSSLVNVGATIAQGIISLKLAEEGRDIAFIRAEVAQLQTFFENNIKQIRSMQEAYNASQRNITSSLQSMQEILEKQQNTRLSVARNI